MCCLIIPLYYVNPLNNKKIKYKSVIPIYFLKPNKAEIDKEQKIVIVFPTDYLIKQHTCVGTLK